MVKFDPKKMEEVKVVGIVSPYVPTVAVFYDFEASKTFTKPVLYFVIREKLLKTGEFFSEIKTYPVCFDKDLDNIVELSDNLDAVGFLGLSSDPKLKKDAFADELRELKKRMKRVG